MRDEKKRMDTSIQAVPLTINPFAQLKAAPEIPEGCDAASQKTIVSNQPQSARPYKIAKTKKGGYPISVERRAAGKMVTILRNISGDVEALLILLKKHCATGGKAFDDSLEIQGDHQKKLEEYLRKQGL